MFDFRSFLLLATRHLHRPIKSVRREFCDQIGSPRLRSWCSWTTFDRLRSDAGYWTEQLPLESELGEDYVADGGTWGQPFEYEALAHVIIPRTFYEEAWLEKKHFVMWDHHQDVDGLSAVFRDAGIEHRISDYALEVKVF